MNRYIGLDAHASSCTLGVLDLFGGVLAHAPGRPRTCGF